MSRRCAIYTRVSTEHGLEQAFTSLDNQREAAEAYIKSQAHEGWRLVREHYDDGGFSGGSMERPALQRLLATVKAGRVDVIIVYKVDRLTRSLADFAKLVELFDTHGVSFVSVTQAFNTTTSMGRLTLNVLLSFAQFEREVTSERIRDKIAASKRRGLWVGGNVPLGYRVEAKRLVVVEPEAEQVRLIYQRYLDLGSIGQLLAELRAKGIRTKALVREGVVVRGGIPFGRGTLGYLLRNRFYVGELVFRDAVHTAEHPPIVERMLFEAVQRRLTEQRNGQATRHAASGALLMGLLHDARGERMTPSHTKKGQRRYRYYVSRTPLDGRAMQGTLPIERVAAPRIERCIVEALRARYDSLALQISDADLITANVVRIDLADNSIHVTLRASDQTPEASGTGDAAGTARPVSLIIPWQRMSARRHREIIRVSDRAAPARAMRIETRATLLSAIARARRWQDQIATGVMTGPDAIAQREGCSRRQINAVLSLASLAPDIVEAAIAGRLPHGIALRDLTDLPLAWSEQRSRIGLPLSHTAQL